MVPSGWQQDDKVVLLGEPKSSVVATDAPPASSFSLSFSFLYTLRVSPITCRLATINRTAGALTVAKPH